MHRGTRAAPAAGWWSPRRQDPLAQTGLGALRQVGTERLRDLGVGHGSAVHASASIARSSARRAACSRHLAVPTGIPERSGDLGDRSLLDVVEDEDHPVLRSQPVERPPDRVVVDELVHRGPGEWVLPRLGRAVFVARVGRTHGHLAEADPMPARHRAAFATIRLSQPSNVAGSRRRGSCRQADTKRVLGGVGRVGVVRQDRPGEPVAAIDPTIDEHLERRRVAGASAPNERVVGRRRPARCPRHRIHIALSLPIVALAPSEIAGRSVLSGVQIPPRARWLGRARSCLRQARTCGRHRSTQTLAVTYTDELRRHARGVT